MTSMKNLRRMLTGRDHHAVEWTAKIQVPPAELRERAAKGWLRTIRGWTVKTVDYRTGTVWLKPKPNLVVNVGFQFAMDLNFNISARTAVRSMGVDNGTTNPTATSVSSTSGGGTDTGST